jgi:hypothetical protein
MNNNQKRMNDVPLPLMMSCTKPTSIETTDCETKVLYDPISQTVTMECMQIGTRSLKTSNTFYGKNHCKTDRKNEIDDKKQK